MGSTTAVNTVDRLVRVLDCFSNGYSTWSLAALSAELDLPKSTLHRFLTSLEIHGILRRDSRDKLWRLGYQLVIWGRLAGQATRLEHLATPVMEQMAEATGEMIALTVFIGREIVCIQKIDTSYSVRLALEIGQRRPIHAGASSKILAAYLPLDEIDAIIAEQGLPQLCENTITDRDMLLHEFSLIRDHGFALSNEETDPHAWGIATPIRDYSNQVVAGLGIAGPTLRYSDENIEKYVAICRDAADQVSRMLGADS